MEKLREQHRLEWENLVITYINQGCSKSDARYNADQRISDKYGKEEYFGESE